MTEDRPTTAVVEGMIDVAILKAVAVAASSDQARPVLAAVAFTLDGDRWQVQATDSHVAAWSGEAPAPEGHRLVDAKALLGAIKMVAARGLPDVLISFTGEGWRGGCTVAGGGGSVKLQLTEGEYPRLERIVSGIKATPTERIGFTPETMGKVCAMAKLLDKHAGFALSLQSDLKPVLVKFCANDQVHMVVMPYRCM